jgi:hypothetical protein
LISTGRLEEPTTEYDELVEFSSNLEKLMQDMSKLELLSLQVFVGENVFRRGFQKGSLRHDQFKKSHQSL